MDKHNRHHLDIIPVTDSSEIEQTAALALTIWNEHYVPIIGQAQVDYMLEKFQNSQAIAQQINNHTFYYLARDPESNRGYCALQPEHSEQSVKLSKIYVLKQNQRRGIGSTLMRFIEQQCINWQAQHLWLTVNKYNTQAIQFYLKMDFEITEALQIDIGNGFIMDDYKMIRKL